MKLLLLASLLAITSFAQTERAVGNSQCDLINDDKSYKCNSYYKKIVKCAICQDDSAGAVDNSAINDAIRNPGSEAARLNAELAKENQALLSAIEDQVGATNQASRWNTELVEETLDLLDAIE